MAIFDLVRHPDHPVSGIDDISVTVIRMPRGSIEIDFDVRGAGASELWEEPQEPAFVDELWQGTCFEAFLTAQGHPGYVELNFTPAGLWAAYSFDSYRSGMRRATGAGLEPGASRWSSATSVRAEAQLSTLPVDAVWRANLSAVIKAKDGTKSYWALAHAPGPPDFHNPACFTATLPPPAQP